jgi:Fur family ferric uptake transcriptional regulator
MVKFNDQLNWWRGQFRQRGYRITAARQVILNILSRTKKHLSAEEVFLAVRKLCPNIGLATVYRTLELLIQMKLVSKLDFGDGRNRYELSESSPVKNHHHHMVCTRCGKVFDYNTFVNKEKELLDLLRKKLSNKYRFKIAGHQIRFYGLCESCK